MMQLKALITVPNDWTKESVADVLEAGLRAEVVLRWRKRQDSKLGFPPVAEFNEVSVDCIDNIYTDADFVGRPPKEEQMQTVTEEEKQPKLDRKTRGQVRRVTNKLKTVERRVFTSSSNPNRSYETVIYADGQVLCNCQGWTMKKAGKPRQCKHTAELIGDRRVVDNGEYQFIEALTLRSPAPFSAED